jgi:hypothetical protein
LSSALGLLTSTAKLKLAFDSVYAYSQNVTVFIQDEVASRGETQFEIVVRPTGDDTVLLGLLRNLQLSNGNFTEKQIADLNAPFKILLQDGGVASEIWTQQDEDVHALKFKTSVLKLLLQNATEIHEYLETGKDSITDDKCQEVTTVNRTLNDFIFETTTKVLDCNGETKLEGVDLDKSEFRVYYHLSKEDERLVHANSIINVVYLASVTARFETDQTLDFVRFDGSTFEVDEAILVEKHKIEDVDKLYEKAE